MVQRSCYKKVVLCTMEFSFVFRRGKIWLIPFKDSNNNNFQRVFLPTLGSRKLSSSKGTLLLFPKSELWNSNSSYFSVLSFFLLGDTHVHL